MSVSASCVIRKKRFRCVCVCVCGRFYVCVRANKEINLIVLSLLHRCDFNRRNKTNALIRQWHHTEYRMTNKHDCDCWYGESKNVEQICKRRKKFKNKLENHFKIFLSILVSMPDSLFRVRKRNFRWDSEPFVLYNVHRHINNCAYKAQQRVPIIENDLTVISCE